MVFADCCADDTYFLFFFFTAGICWSFLSISSVSSYRHHLSRHRLQPSFYARLRDCQRSDVWTFTFRLVQLMEIWACFLIITRFVVVVFCFPERSIIVFQRPLHVGNSLKPLLFWKVAKSLEINSNAAFFFHRTLVHLFLVENLKDPFKIFLTNSLQESLVYLNTILITKRSLKILSKIFNKD